MSTPDFSSELTDGLSDAATTVDPGDGAAALAEVRGTAARRGRRRRAAMGAAAVGALVAGGAVVANVVSSDGDDMIASSPAPIDTEAAPAETGPVTTEETEPEAPSPTADVEIADTPEPPVDVVLPVTPSSMEEFDGDRYTLEEQGMSELKMYPWDGGFLTVNTAYVPRSVPAVLPPELAERLPQEALDLFPDGFPTDFAVASPTLGSALLELPVYDIILADPELNDLFFGGQLDPITSFRFSENGDEWNDIDVMLPVDDHETTFASTGDRFVVASPAANADGIVTDDPTEVDVWSSTDLVNWERHVATLPSVSLDLPDFVDSSTRLRSVTANDDAWVITVGRLQSLDVVELLDDDQRARMQAGNGLQSSRSDTGITVTIFPDAYVVDGPNVGEDIEFTWEELGVDGPIDEGWEGLAVTARWGGDSAETEISPGADAFDTAEVVALDSGFVSFGSDLRLSSDGAQWSTAQLPEPGTIDWVIETDIGLLVGGNYEDSTKFRLLFDPASSEFSTVDVAAGPDSANEMASGSNAVVVEYVGDPPRPPEPIIAQSSGENGFVLELNLGLGGVVNSPSYSLTDAASGATVASEALDSTETVADFEFLSEVDDEAAGFEGYRITDPDSGEVLAEVPFDDMIDTFSFPANNVPPITVSEFGNRVNEFFEALDDYDERFPEGAPEAESWLFASVDGSLIVEQLDRTFTVVPSDDEELVIPVGWVSVVVQGDVVLVVRVDGTTVRVAVDG